MSNTLPVNEMFETIQGEATFTGTPAVFVRTQGCPVGCPWCDTKHTWDIEPPFKIAQALLFMKTDDTKHYAEFKSEELMEALDQYSARHIVITGGEPCMHDLTEITRMICDSGRTCQIETSGTFPIRCDDRVFVTLSPKIDMPGGLEVLDEAYARADEIKFPMGKEADLKKIAEKIMPHKREGQVFWLQPLSQSPKATDLCVKTAIKNNWRVSIQTHKFIGVR